MGGSRRRLKKTRAKVQVALPKKNPNVFKPNFTIPPKLRLTSDGDVLAKWENTASVITNYKSFGFVSNPNIIGARSRAARVVETELLQVPPSKEAYRVEEFGEVDDGSDLEEDDLKSALNKKRKDGKTAPLQPLTAMQRVHIGRLVEKHGDNYQAMFMDLKLNAMQHTVTTLEKLCKRYHMYKDKNPLILIR
ncbi:hypothetical protein ACHQM5_015170 [Ranunculus cassubicifolius]